MIGAAIDLLGGAAQVALAGHLLRSRRGALALALSAFLALNGLAFVSGNLVPRGHPMFPLLRLTVWGTLNWIAFVAVVVTAAMLARRSRQAHVPLAVAGATTCTVAVLSWVSAPPSVTPVAFGGAAAYAGVAGLLVVCGACASRGGRAARDASILVTMTAVNSGLHAGVALAAGADAYATVHAGLLIALGGWWLLGEADLPAKLQAAAALWIPVAAGFAFLLLLGSVGAVQDSGLYGFGRMISVVAGAAALQRGLLFQVPY